MDPTLLKLIRDFEGVAPEDVQRITIELYDQQYCASPLIAHDGKRVVFKSIRFHHAFFSSDRKRSIPGSKDEFQVNRAARIDWIRVLVEASIKGVECWEVPPESKGAARQRLYLFWDPVYLVWLFDNPPEGFEFSTAYHASTEYARKKLKFLRAKMIWRRT